MNTTAMMYGFHRDMVNNAAEKYNRRATRADSAFASEDSVSEGRAIRSFSEAGEDKMRAYMERGILCL